jgi:glycosyltransferase involved in cell wall biosynthesis
VTFLTVAPEDRAAAVARELEHHCDEAIVLPDRTAGGTLSRLGRRLEGAAYCAWTGEKRSNYVINRLHFPPARLEPFARSGKYACVLYEYWHANDSAEVFRRHGVPTVLDMHNVLWQSRLRQLSDRPGVPGWARRALVARYRRREERAWHRFDALIAINRAEHAYATSRLGGGAVTFYAPMGVPLDRWPYRWDPATPPRVAYYGGLSTRHNQESAVQCVKGIMPLVWERFPEAELWLVGSNPPTHIRALEGDRVRVTGFVEDVPKVLSRMTAVLCPWKGTYGFRSRIIEVMSLGLPVVATPDAVHGMDLTAGSGLLLADSDEALARHTIDLLARPAYAAVQSRAARDQVVSQYGFDSTYGQLATELASWSAGQGGAA